MDFSNYRNYFWFNMGLLRIGMGWLVVLGSEVAVILVLGLMGLAGMLSALRLREVTQE